MIDVTYIDHMGTDLSVVNAARVSFNKTSSWELTDWRDSEDYARKEVLSEADTKLINYLAKHKHTSPFGHAFASFHVKAPIFVARQLVKHKFLRWNEISRRYVDNEPEFYEPDEWRGKSADKKQGSDGVVELRGDSFGVGYEPWWGDGSLQETTLNIYKDLLEQGVCPEQARMVLPQSTMTEWYWSGSLDAFADMCNLRCAGDTQLETRLVANKICNSMKELFPVSWFALRLEK
jgi:thymidylate synthase (FAD)